MVRVNPDWGGSVGFSAFPVSFLFLGIIASARGWLKMAQVIDLGGAGGEQPASKDVENRGKLSSDPEGEFTPVNAMEIFGEKLDPMPPLYVVALHALMHKPLLLGAPAIPTALSMVLASWFPTCGITEDELPRVPFIPGVNSRWAEFLTMRCIYSVRRIVVFFFSSSACSILRKRENPRNINNSIF